MCPGPLNRRPAWRVKTIAGCPISPQKRFQNKRQARPRPVFETPPAGDRKIQGLPESSAYPVPQISGAISGGPTASNEGVVSTRGQAYFAQTHDQVWPAPGRHRSLLTGTPLQVPGNSLPGFGLCCDYHHVGKNTSRKPEDAKRVAVRFTVRVAFGFCARTMVKTFPRRERRVRGTAN